MPAEQVLLVHSASETDIDSFSGISRIFPSFSPLSAAFAKEAAESTSSTISYTGIDPLLVAAECPWIPGKNAGNVR
jgi:hypothetical protein